MTWKQLDRRISEWLFKMLLSPLALAAPYLRTNYWIEGRNIVFQRPFTRSVSIKIDDFDEIGVETTDQGPFVEDVFWILTRGQAQIRIGEPHPVFNQLMDRVGSLEGFDWRPFTEAMCCSDNRYFLCWRRTDESD